MPNEEKSFRTNLVLDQARMQKVLELMAWTVTPTKHEVILKAIDYYHQQLNRKEHAGKKEKN